ncbi:MAG: UBP-type zinc finger domain-containing protein [Bacteroidia bacterium]
MSQNAPCTHLADGGFEPIGPDAYFCVECVKTGDRWVHLRRCTTCGQAHCCDSSPNRHATRHHHATGHPVVISAEPGERWAWCYVDEVMVRY